MTATLTIMADDTGALAREVLGLADKMGAAPAARGKATKPSTTDGEPWSATLSAVPYDVLLTETMRRAADKGFVLTMSQMDTAAAPAAPEPAAITPATVTTAAPAAPLDDVSGGGDADLAKPEGEDADVAANTPPAEATPEDIEAAQVKTRQAAVDLLMQVYARGSKGQAECRKVREVLAVKKFADVPLSQADRLLDMAKAADAAVPVKAAG